MLSNCQKPSQDLFGFILRYWLSHISNDKTEIYILAFLAIKAFLKTMYLKIMNMKIINFNKNIRCKFLILSSVWLTVMCVNVYYWSAMLKATRSKEVKNPCSHNGSVIPDCWCSVRKLKEALMWEEVWVWVVHWLWPGLPVNTQSTQTQHCDPHWGFLDKRHQLAQSHPKRPVLRQELERERELMTELNHEKEWSKLLFSQAQASSLDQKCVNLNLSVSVNIQSCFLLVRFNAFDIFLKT